MYKKICVVLENPWIKHNACIQNEDSNIIYKNWQIKIYLVSIYLKYLIFKSILVITLKINSFHNKFLALIWIYSL